MIRRTVATHCAAFFVGCIVILTVAYVGHLSYVKGEIGHAHEVLKQWGLFLDGNQLLTIPIPDRGMVVTISSDQTGDVSRGDIEVLREKVGAVFEFHWQGPYGAPSAKYAGGVVGQGHDWVDYNSDGIFDTHIDMGAKRISIRTDNGWTAATKIVDHVAHTSDGMFKFNTTSGEWAQVSNSK